MDSGRETLLLKVMDAVRVRSKTAEDEIKDLIESCISELRIAGVWLWDSDLSDPMVEQVIKLYCKARYGYDDGSERFWDAFCGLRDRMALSGDYCKRCCDGRSDFTGYTK